MTPSASSNPKPLTQPLTPRRLTQPLTCACRSICGFQSVSYMMTVSAACRLSPTPPARTDSRKTNARESGRQEKGEGKGLGLSQGWHGRGKAGKRFVKWVVTSTEGRKTAAQESTSGAGQVDGYHAALAMHKSLGLARARQGRPGVSGVGCQKHRRLEDSSIGINHKGRRKAGYHAALAMHNFQSCSPRAAATHWGR